MVTAIVMTKTLAAAMARSIFILANTLAIAARVTLHSRSA